MQIFFEVAPLAPGHAKFPAWRASVNGSREREREEGGERERARARTREAKLKTGDIDA